MQTPTDKETVWYSTSGRNNTSDRLKQWIRLTSSNTWFLGPTSQPQIARGSIQPFFHSSLMYPNCRLVTPHGCEWICPTLTPSVSLGLPESAPKTSAPLVQPFWHSSPWRLLMLFNALAPKIALSPSGCGPNLILGPNQVSLPNGITIGSASSEQCSLILTIPCPTKDSQGWTKWTDWDNSLPKDTV